MDPADLKFCAWALKITRKHAEGTKKSQRRLLTCFKKNPTYVSVWLYLIAKGLAQATAKLAVRLTPVWSAITSNNGGQPRSVVP